MELLEKLDKILRVKNEIRDILGENNNFSRYPTAIYNYLAARYNEGWIAGYSDRYEYYNDKEIYNIEGDERLKEIIINYGVNPEHYEVYDTGALVNLMSDVLNYKLLSKENLEVDDDWFINYPTYLQTEYEEAYEEGYIAGAAAMDEDYGDAGEVEEPVLTNDDNLISFTYQNHTVVYYTLNEGDSKGTLTQYTSPFYIGGPCSITYYAKRGVRTSDTVTETLTYNPSGKTVVFPPTIEQNENTVTINSTTPNSIIEYHLDSGDFRTYYSPIPITNSNRIVYARATRAGNYSATVSQTLTHTPNVTMPANVRCKIEVQNNNRIVTLSCPTSNATIHYAIDDNTGEFLVYHNQFVVSQSKFELWAYSEVGGVTSQTLYYKYDPVDEAGAPLACQCEVGSDYIRIFTLTAGAIVKWQYEYGQVNTTTSNEVVLYPSDGAKINAWSCKNGYEILSSFVFTRTKKQKCQDPIIKLVNSSIVISTPYTARFSIDGSDPRGNVGNIFTWTAPVLVSEPVYVMAVAVDSSGKFDVSNVVTANLDPSVVIDYEYDGTSSGGDQGGNGDTSADYFWFSPTESCTINFVGQLAYSVNKSQFITVTSTTEFTTPGQRYYLRGNNLSSIKFSKDVVIGGNIFSLALGTSFNSSNYTSDISMAGLFKDNEHITNASQVKIPVTEIGPSQFESLFENCNNMTLGPRFGIDASGTVTSVDAGGLRRAFANCSSMNSLAINFSFTSDSFIGAEALAECFKGTRLSSISLSIDKNINNIGQSAFKDCFNGCLQLSGGNIILDAMVLNTSVYEGMFKHCQNFAAFINLPAVAAFPKCYKEMFYNCKRMDDFGTIALTTVADECCYGMFQYCENLRVAPTLYSQSLRNTSDPYAYMFNGCSNLYMIQALFKEYPNGQYTKKWVSNVATYGIFYYNENAPWGYSVAQGQFRGQDGIPVSWEVKPYQMWGSIDSVTAFKGYLTFNSRTNYRVWFSTNDGYNWLLYDADNKPYISKVTRILACCGPEDATQAKLIDAAYGPIWEGDVDPNFTEMSPYSRDMKIWFHGEDEYSITFSVNNVGGWYWRDYQGVGFDPIAKGIEVDESLIVHIVATGYVNGEPAASFDGYIPLDLDAPAIHFDPTWTASRKAFTMSYPYPYEANKNIKFRYKYNSNDWDYAPIVTASYESGNGGRWQYTVLIPQDLFNSTTAKEIRIYAKAIKPDGTESGVRIVDAVWGVGATNEANIFKDIDVEKDGNGFIIIYGGERITSWTNTNPSLWYKLNASQEYLYTEGPFCPYNNVQERGKLEGTNSIMITAIARIGAIDKVEVSKTLTFSWNDYINNQVTLNAPDFYISPEVDSGGKTHYYINMSNNTLLSSGNYQIVNQVRVKSGAEWSSNTMNSIKNTWSGWQNLNSGNRIEIPNNDSYAVLTKAVFEYRSWLGTTDNYTDIYEYPDDGTYWENALAVTKLKDPHATQDGNKIMILQSDIDDFNYSTVYFYIETTASDWTSGAVDIHKYDEYTNSYVQNGGNYYYILVDEHLKYGKCHIKYYSTTYNLWSENEYVFDYINVSVKEVSDATCRGQAFSQNSMNWLVCYIKDDDRGLYYNCNKNYVPEISVTKTNTLSSITFYFRIKQNTASWGGGILDDTIYDSWKLCAQPYGTNIHDALLSATFEIKAVDANNNESSVGEVIFTNGLSSALSGAEISFTPSRYVGPHGNATNEIVITNSELRATHYYKITEPIYNPGGAGSDTSYVVWSGANKQLSDILVCGYCYAYSEFGRERVEALNSGVWYNNENLSLPTMDPPTITTKYIPGTNTYQLIMTNKAGASGVDILCWRIVNTQWGNPEEIPSIRGKNYYEPQTDNYFYQQTSYDNTYSTNILKNLKYGLVECFVCSSWNGGKLPYGNKNYDYTAMTTYEYTNSYWD